jgi:hypothetical protein
LDRLRNFTRKPQAKKKSSAGPSRDRTPPTPTPGWGAPPGVKDYAAQSIRWRRWIVVPLRATQSVMVARAVSSNQRPHLFVQAVQLLVEFGDLL